jgi:hypothetical protein
MDKFINKQGLMVEIFDNEQEAEQGGEIGDAILAARSLRRTVIAVEMSGKCVLDSPLRLIYKEPSIANLCRIN